MTIKDRLAIQDLSQHRDAVVRARWYIQEILKDTSGMTSLVFGTDDDSYRRTKAGWRFSYRRFDLLLRNPLLQDGVIALPFPADLNKPF